MKKHKLTPQAHKEIIEAARVLPKLVRVNTDGSPMYRTVSHTAMGRDMITRDKFGEEQLPKMADGVKFNPNKLYVQKLQEPVWINHEVEMINRFWKGGTAGVQAYINRVHEIANKDENVEPRTDEGGANANA